MVWSYLSTFLKQNHSDNCLINESDVAKVQTQQSANGNVSKDGNVVGTITLLNGNFCIVDDEVFVAKRLLNNEEVWSSLIVGMKVSYSARYNLDRGIKEALSLEIIDNVECHEIDIIKKFIENWKKNSDKYDYCVAFIRKINSESLYLEAVNFRKKRIIASLKELVFDFDLCVGDKVIVCCLKGLDYIVPVNVTPFQLKLNAERQIVELSRKDGWASLSGGTCADPTVLQEINFDLFVGQKVKADLVACNKPEFEWRCIRIYDINHHQPLKIYSKYSSIQPAYYVKNPTLLISRNVDITTKEIPYKKWVAFHLKNNTPNPISAVSLESVTGCSSNVAKIKPDTEKGSGRPFSMRPFERTTIEMQVNIVQRGKAHYKVQFKLGSFRIFRFIRITANEAAKTLSLREDKVNNNNNTSDGLNGGSMNGDGVNGDGVNDDGDNDNGDVLVPGKFMEVVTPALLINDRNFDIVPGIGLSSKPRLIENRFPSYDMPVYIYEAFMSLQAFSDSQRDFHRHLDRLLPQLREALSYRNYAEYFHTLLYLEEMERFMELQQLNRKACRLKREGEYLILPVQMPKDMRCPWCVGDKAMVTFTEVETESDTGSAALTNTTKKCYEGIVHKTEGDKLYLKFDKVLHLMYRDEEVDVQFLFSRYNFRKQHYAIHRATQNFGSDFLFPTEFQCRSPQFDIWFDSKSERMFNDQGEQISWHDTELNAKQKHAVYQILRGETANLPYLVYGPPGTGKTRTLTEIILQLTNNLIDAYILVATSTNSAADLIASKLIQSGVLPKQNILRLVSLNVYMNNLLPEGLASYSATIDIGINRSDISEKMKITESGFVENCTSKKLSSYRVVIGTLATIGNLMNLDLGTSHFTHVLIDEGSQCTEPEAMIAITQIAARKGQVVLAGDPKQLPATIKSRYAENKGLSLSFFERILMRPPYKVNLARYPNTSGYNGRLVTKLLHNYRSLASIIEVPNRRYYNSEVVPIIGDRYLKDLRGLRRIQSMQLCKTDSEKHAVFFVALFGEDRLDVDSTSWYNEDEAHNICMQTLGLYTLSFRPEQIGIITPYLRQVQALQTQFKISGNDMPKIGTVNEFQGLERDVIIISTVRSHNAKKTGNPLGFLKCARRFNVAITRARMCLIVFGNPSILRQSPDWNDLIGFCQSHNAYHNHGSSDD